ncbi:hypothetical protein CVU76_01200 [Candidatus Dojkabacteria bacterium HGW-Dojkabacteria-1]|uniref:DUF2304 domain-containing protein n=1 Tax=Candidatus Dojkabacteria bacterium HGW-Dojkabacteria-1 TaxID=2013761 RepID=A0A2N2F384_9BACT|nr:MAG: hypothetical protein CVU76_01200 [Candidatus Dojkabacteria bacterium HGW-Dojkabacteria-1]
MVIQIVVTLGVLVLVIPSIYSSYKKKSMTPFGAFLWILFWIAGLILIWFPHLIDVIGSGLGVGRSIDAFVYIGIVYLLYVSLNQKIKLNEIKREITLLNRKLALRDVEEEKK